ncbi:glycerophosphodiester phosphodiesterase family protein [Pasteurella testudinis]|uniref:glycerophosphodiester phosphodiesterase family protein n=1 Tax=Pasteurella testudinis TaxID=761 RepID=UPI00405854BF
MSNQYKKYYLSALLTALLLPPTAFAAAAERAPNKPQLIAHRGGTADAPENTLYAIEQALKNGADAIWVTVQLSQDNIPVLYRPSDLSARTNLNGAVSSYTAAQLQQADAAWLFDKDNNYPLRQQAIGVPSLSAVLAQFPQTFFYLDLKSPDAEPQTFADAVRKAVHDANAQQRIRIYSTEQAFTAAIGDSLPTFASRDTTRNFLAQTALAGDRCPNEALTQTLWHGFELNRKVKVVETFTLGEGVSEGVLTWSPHEVNCFNQTAAQHIILFGINNAADYQRAVELNVDGVMVDSPKQAAEFAK